MAKPPDKAAPPGATPGDDDIESRRDLPQPWSASEDGEGEADGEERPASRFAALKLGTTAWIVLGVVVAIGAAVATLPLWRDALPADVIALFTGDGAATDGRGERSTPVETAETALPPQPAEPPPPAVGQQEAAIAALTARLERLEASLARLRAAEPRLPASLDDRIARLDARIGRLNAESARRADTDRYGAALAAMSQRVNALESALTKVRQAGAAGRSDALLLAIGQLRDPVSRGVPFTNELAALSAVAGRIDAVNRAVAPLVPLAGRGVPTLATLQGRFAAAARAAAQAALAPEQGDWIDRTVARLGSVVTVRRVGADVAGDAPDAVVARAESRLAAGDLPGAVAALKMLDGAPAAAVAGWLRDAEARLAADAALASLTRMAIARLPKAADGAPPSGGDG